MARLTDDNLVTIARAEAFVDRADKPYLPQSIEERDAFDVHGWVIKAMRQAMATGYEQGRLDQHADTLRQTQ